MNRRTAHLLEAAGTILPLMLFSGAGALGYRNLAFWAIGFASGFALRGLIQAYSVR